ncbi:MAG: hypothetical protein FWE13_06680 [Firmicutes bacterium]|nr:hypothetical protein [Bacillota bacterium]
MKKTIRKMMILGIALVMLFSFLGLVGCENCSITTTPSLTLEEYREVAKQTFARYVEVLDENDFIEENWTRILGYVEDGKTAINVAIDKMGVDTALAKAKEQIRSVEMVDIRYSECGRFSLAVSVEQATLPYGESTVMTAVFRNLTDRRYEIIRRYIMGLTAFSLVPYIFSLLEMPHYNDYIEANEEIVHKGTLPTFMRKGRHRLTAYAFFILNNEKIEFVSNLIIITIT